MRLLDSVSVVRYADHLVTVPRTPIALRVQAESAQAKSVILCYLGICKVGFYLSQQYVSLLHCMQTERPGDTRSNHS